MPDLEGSREALLHAGHETRRRATHAWNNFLDFLIQDNVLEIAVGLILASAFTAIVSSLTTDVLLPIVSLLPFLNRNLEEKFAVLHPGPNAHNSTGYQTVEQALSDGAVVLAYGNFLDKCFRFIAVGVTLYVVARTYGWVAKDDIIKKKVKCRYCRKQISEKALRCFECTTWQDGRED